MLILPISDSKEIIKQPSPSSISINFQYISNLIQAPLNLLEGTQFERKAPNNHSILLKRLARIYILSFSGKDFHRSSIYLEHPHLQPLSPPAMGQLNKKLTSFTNGSSNPINLREIPRRMFFNIFRRS
jgi:hypothetical protein